MRITCTVKGDMEDYIKAEVERTGISSAMVLHNLALQGMDYKKAVDGISQFSLAMQNPFFKSEFMKKAENSKAAEKIEVSEQPIDFHDMFSRSAEKVKKKDE